ncbi:hypothetical protein QE152_g17049 [Popillia japonica]|uniref:Uncharacterized protein n=1 Tax=Popillia japonica TaxID=7064 RepID=A0AAW1L5G3_POPJA
MLPELSVKSSTITPKVRQNKGRPKKSFEGSSQRTKRRIIKPMLTNTSPELLCSVTQNSLTKSGKRTAAQVVGLALTTSARIFKRMKQIHDNPSCCTAKPYSSEEATALSIDTDLGKEDYIYLQKGAKSRGVNIYPPYNVIAKIKKQCYPSKIKITETEVQIPVQDILNHTIERLAYVLCNKMYFSYITTTQVTYLSK